MSIYFTRCHAVRRAFAVLLAAALALSHLAPASVITAAPATTLKLIVPPGPFAVDTVITASLVVDNAQNLAGFQGVIRFDPAQLIFAGLTLSEGLAQSGRTPLRMGPVRLEGAVGFGAATCPAAECHAAHPDPAQLQGQGVNGRIELAQVQFYVVGPGPQTLTLTDAQLVNPLGQRLDEGEAAQTAAGLPGWDPQLDITGNQFINDADAGSLIEVWTDLQRRGICLAPGLENRDINQDGCLGVADVQTVLAAWGSTSPALAAALKGAQVIPASVTLTVNSDLSESDLTPGNGVCLTASGVCTLPAAVEESNARPGQETITFNVRNPDGSCPSLVVIQPISTTQITIDDPRGDGVTIDGYTQCNAKPNTSSTYNGNAVIKIELKGRRVTNNPDGSYNTGIEVQSPNNVIRGLDIYEFYRQIWVHNLRASDNLIEGNQLGKSTSYGSAAFGEGLRMASPSNTVGGTTPQARNVIGGSNGDGMNIEGQDANYNVVIGNYIGLRQDGLTTAGNYADGIDIAEGAAYNRIGGPTAAERNVISGQGRDGVEVSHQLGTAYNWIEGNYIGLAANGTTARGNNNHGITLEDLPNHTTVINNIIVASAYDGIGFFPNANYNQILNNWIGVLPNGTPMGNGTVVPGSIIYGRNGIYLLGGSRYNLIKGNVIAHNPQYGILLTKVESAGYGETHFNTFSQNRIYNNGDDGIQLDKYWEDGTYPNEHMLAPQITSAGPVEVKGTSTLSNTAPCVGCQIEIFIADATVTTLDPDGETAGEGRTFIGEGLTDSNGAFSVSVSGVSVGQKVTATATDTRGNTSEFAQNMVVVLINYPPNAADDTATTPNNIPVTIAVLDNDTDPNVGQALSVVGVSTPALGGASTNGTTVVYTPTVGFEGTQVFTYTVSDGSLTDMAQITVTVTPFANHLPVAGADTVSTAEDTPRIITTTLLLNNDTDADGDTLTVTGVSPTSAQGGTVTLSGSNVTYTPPPNYYGQDTFTYSISDDQGGTATGTVTVNVTSVNDTPTVSGIEDQTTLEDIPMGEIPFTVGDRETPAGSLTVSGSSSNTTLVPNASIVFGGSTGDRTVTVTPAANKFGSTVITLTVNDGSGGTATETFILTVTPVDDLPTISNIGNQTILMGTSTGSLSFQIGDLETPAGSLTLSGSSSNTTLAPSANIVFGGSGTNRTVTVTPAANQSGVTIITITVSDGELTASDTFTLTVTSPSNTPPSISNIADKITAEDTATGAIPFTVDDETAAGSLTVSGSSSNTTLAPNANIVFGGSGTNRTVTITPAQNRFGTTTITVIVSDGSGGSRADTFVLIVTSVNDPPTISDIGNQTVLVVQSTGAISFTIGDVEMAAGNLTVSGSSSNAALAPNANIVFGGSGTNRTVTITPAANQSGIAVITILVSDGELTASDTFTLTVMAGSSLYLPLVLRQP